LMSERNRRALDTSRLVLAKVAVPALQALR
jgi:hypothetical protein